jgi:hypothetical protein
MQFNALERRHRELDLPERVDPRDDNAPVSDHSDAGLPEVVPEPPRKLVPRLAVERARSR